MTDNPPAHTPPVPAANTPRRGCLRALVVTIVVLFVAHLILVYLPNRDDDAVRVIEQVGGQVRRTPRLHGLSTFMDAEIYPMGDVWLMEINDAVIDDRVAEKIAGLKALTHLDFYRCRFMAGIKSELIPASAELRSVYASETNMNDSQLRRLEECPNLGFLMLTGTEVTDASVPTISRCRSLGCVVLRRNKVTPAGAAVLQSLLPHANVKYE